MKKIIGRAGGDAITTLLGSGARIDGLLEFTGTVRLDGEMEGRIEGREGTLIVGEGASIRADITVAKAIVMGEIHGTLRAAERIELHPPGRVAGDLEAPVVMVQAGAVLNGQCTMKRTPRTAPDRLSSTAAAADSEAVASAVG